MHHHLILRVVAKLLIPPILLFALYVQFHGDYGPGGGFQAGVIFGAGFILYGLIFGIENAQRLMPQWLIVAVASCGVLLYMAVGVASMIAGGTFLDYSVLATNPQAGQHIGILIIELGVGITVTAVMIACYLFFAARTRHLPDEEW